MRKREASVQSSEMLQGKNEEKKMNGNTRATEKKKRNLSSEKVVKEEGPLRTDVSSAHAPEIPTSVSISSGKQSSAKKLGLEKLERE